MQKVILDTNVIVAGLIGKSYPFHILQFALDNQIQLLYSEQILKEYLAVLQREKFSHFKDFQKNAALVISYIEESGVEISTTSTLKMLEDTSDNKFLEAAVDGQVDFIITGNTNDFTISKIENTKILPPKEYWENFKPDGR